MITDLPFYIEFTFILATILTLLLFFKASHYNRTFALISMGWLTLQAVLAYKLFFTNTTVLPPRIILTFAPTFAFMVVMFTTKKGKSFIDSLDINTLTLLHIVRIPVEFVLYWLFIYKQIPEIMTFTGQNFDILAGITAPFVLYYGFIKKRLSKLFLMAWNILSLLLLFNIIITAILCAPLPFQQLAFEQPNVGILYFPFIWLPGFVVPVVLFSHFSSIRILNQTFKK